MRQELSPAVDDYLRFRASNGIAKNTLANEKSTLKLLLRTAGNLWVHQLDGNHVTRFFEEAARTRQAGSLAPMYACLSQFFEWARHTRRMPVDSDPMFGRRRPKRVKRERQRFPVTKFPAFLDAAEAVSPWHRALCGTLLYTLLRGSEVTDLRVRDVDLDAGYLTARIFKSKLEDRMPISEELDGELRRWLTHYTTEVGELLPHYYLLPRRLPKPVNGERGRITHTLVQYGPELSTGAIARYVNPILGDIGVDVNEKGEGGHTVRRSGARALFDALSEAHHPRPLRVVKDMLHHESEVVTERYIGVEADRLDRDHVLKGRAMYGRIGEVTRLRHVM